MTIRLQRSTSPVGSRFHVLSKVGAVARSDAARFDGMWNTGSTDGAVALAGGPG